jgi:Tfp pilus assembly protein PilO
VKVSDRRILLGVAGVAALIAFYLLVLSPKRAELSELKTDVDTAATAAADAEQLAAAAEQAKGTYKSDYQHLVVLGKAVPGDDDVSSLLDQVNGLSGRSGIRFNSLKLSSAGASGAAPPAATPTPTEPPAEPPAGEPAPSTDSTAVPAGSPVPATESAAAPLPLGASVGSAGLPTMPYDLTFTGGFFDIADFISGLDGMVKVRDDGLGVDGRLLTIDGFSLQPSADGFPELDVNLHVTSYVTPADQGLTAGATPTAPATTTTAAAPASTAVPTAPIAATSVGVR